MMERERVQLRRQLPVHPAPGTSGNPGGQLSGRAKPESRVHWVRATFRLQRHTCLPPRRPGVRPRRPQELQSEGPGVSMVGVGRSAPPSTDSLYAPYFDDCRPQREGGGRSGAGSDGVNSSPCPSPAPSGSSGRRGVRSPEPRSPLLCGGQCVPTSPRGSAADGAGRARPESGRVPLPDCFSSRPQFSFTARK